ncbi:MAG: Cache 3/Cache 2 fusion domain-containing protein [Salinivirgaceae bacterium]
MKIGPKFYLAVSVATLAIFTIFAVYLRNHIASVITSNFTEAMKENMANFDALIRKEAQANFEKTIVGGNLAQHYFHNLGQLQIHPDKAVLVENIPLPKWTINNEQIQNSTAIVDELQQMGNEVVTIFQRSDDGYVRISTNVKDEHGKRAVGTLLGPDSEVVKAIEQGRRFQGRVWAVGKWYVTDYQPIILNSQIVGMVSVGNRDLNYEKLSQFFATKSYFGSGYPYVSDANGIVVAHPTEPGVDVSETEFFKTMQGQTQGVVVYDWHGKEKTQFYRYISEIDGYLTVGWYTQDFQKIIRSITIIFIVATILAIILLITVVVFIVRKVVGGVKRAVYYFEMLSEGNLVFDIPEKELQLYDEFGQLARAGEKMQKKLIQVISDVKDGTGSVVSASSQLSAGSEQVSQGASEQASSTEEIGSSIENIISTIEMNNKNSQQAKQISTEVRNGIENLKISFNDSLLSIRHIASKIDIINQIAFQTNILALNAAVEAAQAGENGKGFAVVAQEVRKLAKRSKEAADEIVDLANKSVTVTEKSNVNMQNLIPEVEKTVTLVQEIVAAGMDQNAKAEQVSLAIQQLNQITQTNAAASEEMATSAEELNSQSSLLNDAVGYFKSGSN